MIAGNAIPKADKQKDPNREIKRPNMGIVSARTTKKKVFLSNPKFFEELVVRCLLFSFVTCKNYKSDQSWQRAAKFLEGFPNLIRNKQIQTYF